ncbi:hypothetical protein FPZ54_19500 [Sphingomonas suaedae]|uniref:Uncharacterized protein n=1 Tax=Sphingomonas suaedae TaxID=2599297 RepID=A0A518RKK0_9SPHN|nr:hypothetical protein [Sphingomonas suaedae]QDX27982.1 hypothetical protein FPZ54_19500 [Sphingomonas suaedae]
MILSIALISLAAMAQEPGDFMPSPPPLDSTTLPELPPRGAVGKVEDAQPLADDRAQEYLVGVFECLRQKRTTDVVAASQILNLKRSDQAIAALLKHRCEPQRRTGAVPIGQTGVPPLRGALFVALYRAQFATRDPGISEAPPVSVDGTGAPLARQQWFAAAYRFANCVTRSASNEARLVVLSPAGSKASLDAFQAMNDRMANCLGAGQQFAVSRPVLTGLLAEALYRSAGETNS